MGQDILLKTMAQINRLKQIVCIEWTDMPQHNKQSDFNYSVTITDIEGNKAVIMLHQPNNHLHGLDHALIRVIVWITNIQYNGVSTIPMGSIATMVNPTRKLLSNAEK